MKRTVLTLGDRFAICKSVMKGTSRKEVADRYNIRPQTVYRILLNREQIFQAIENGVSPKRRFIRRASGPKDTITFKVEAISESDSCNDTCLETDDGANCSQQSSMQEEPGSSVSHVKTEAISDCSPQLEVVNDVEKPVTSTLQQLPSELDFISHSDLFSPSQLESTERDLQISDVPETRGDCDDEFDDSFAYLQDEKQVQPVIESNQSIHFNHFLNSLEVVLTYCKQQNETQWQSMLDEIKWQAIEKHLIDLVSLE